MELDKICSNSAPLWHLGRVKEIFPAVRSLDLIKEVYNEVYVPTEVLNELGVRIGNNNQIASYGQRIPLATRNYIFREIIHVPVKNKSKVDALNKKYGPGLGECAVLVLSEEIPCISFLANNGAEKMFDAEEKLYQNIIPFADFCFQRRIINESEAHDYLQALWDIKYRQNGYEPIFKKFGIKQ